MPKAYVVLKDREIRGVMCATKGSTIFECIKPDYGGASDDTQITGVEHISVTDDPDGGYPYFTISVFDIQELP